MSQLPIARGSPLTSLEDEQKPGNTDPEMIILSLMWNDIPRPMPLLRIPKRIIGFFSNKPRRWLMYVATIICGVDGTLRYFDSDDDISEVEMENAVNGGDHLVFHLSGEPNFVDWHLRNQLRSRSSVTSEAPQELKEYYRGCPFSLYNVAYCQSCHLIPFARGTEYLRDLLRLRGAPDDGITINSNQNLVLLSANLHVPFDMKDIGFLKTPNRFLKTNEISGLENEDAQSYRVTLHYFVDNEEMRPALCHGSHSDLTRGSGLARPITPEDHDPDDHRPNDLLLDLTYVSGLLAHWSHEEGAKFLAEDSKRRYGETLKRGEDPEGQQMREERWRRREGNNAQRDARTLQCSDGIPAPADGLDFILYMHYRVRNTTPEQFKAEIERHRKEVEGSIKKRMDTWGEDLHARRTTGDLEDPEPSIISPDDDGEIPVSVEDALNRPTPNYPIRSMPSLTHSTSTDSDELGAESDLEPYEGSEGAERQS